MKPWSPLAPPQAVKLVLHIVRKDFLRLRWPLAGWVAVVVLQLALGFALVAGAGLREITGQQLEWLNVGLRIAGYALTFVLAAMLVQEDGLVGSNLFWITRPISSRRLLAAKLAGWFLLLALPQIVLTVPWWLTCGFGARQMAVAALELLAIQAAVALPAALVASLTDTLSRFLVWAFVFMFAAVIIPGTLKFWVPNSFTEQGFPRVLAMFWAGFAVAIGAVTAGQFLRRDVKRSLVRLGVGTVLAPGVVAVAGMFLIPLIISRPAWVDVHPERVAGITVSPVGWRASAASERRRGEAFLYTDLAVRGMPRELFLAGGSAVSAKQAWRWPGGPVVTRDSIWLNSWNNGQPAWRTALGLSPLRRDEETERHYAEEEAKRVKANPDYEERSRAIRRLRREFPVGVEVMTLVLPSTVARMRQAAPAYEATVRLRAMRPEVKTEIPVKSTGWLADGGHGFRVAETEFGPPRIVSPAGGATAPSELRLRLAATTPDFLWDRVLEREDHWDESRRPGLIAFHREGGDVQWGGLSGGPTVTIGSVTVRLTQMIVWAPVVRRGGKGVVRDPQWFDGARLALVVHREEARFTREVKAERFEPAR